MSETLGIIFLRPRTELKHTLVDKDDYEFGKMSVRHWPIGKRIQGEAPRETLILRDKIIYEIRCSHCGSQSTFHSFIQLHEKRGCKVDNVWRFKQYKSFNEDKTKTYCFSAKYDFCFDCQQEFLIECFLYDIDREVVPDADSDARDEEI
jgi:hypothetical protein